MKKKLLQLVASTFLLISLMAVGRLEAHAGSVSAIIPNANLSESNQNQITFDVTLSPEPTSEVTTNFLTNGECVLGYNNEGFTTGGSVVTQNGTLPFAVRSVDDSEFEGTHSCQITFNATSTTDAEYMPTVSASYTFSVEDNDSQASYRYSTQKLTTARLREGDSFVERYRVSSSQPSSYPIVITAIAGDQCDLLSGVAPNQSRTQSIEKIIPAGAAGFVEFAIIPTDDSDFEGIHQCAIEHTAATSDSNYSGLSVGTYTTSIEDNETNPNIPDQREYEGGLIYFEDANSDGINDSEQPQVTSFISQVNEKRQGLAIVDQSGALAESCEIRGEPTVVAAPQSALLESEIGELGFDVSCRESGEYAALWLLDTYYPDSATWGAFGYSSDGSFVRVTDSFSTIFDVGEGFVSAFQVPLADLGQVRIIQSVSAIAGEQLPDDVLTSVEPESRSPAEYGLLAIAGVAVLALGTIVYRRYFGSINTDKSSYSKVDKF